MKADASPFVEVKENVIYTVSNLDFINLINFYLLYSHCINIPSVILTVEQREQTCESCLKRESDIMEYNGGYVDEDGEMKKD